MKLEFDRTKIKLNADCRHQAWNEKCLPCMYNFQILHITEIQQTSLQKVMTKHKQAGDFL